MMRLSSLSLPAVLWGFSILFLKVSAIVPPRPSPLTRRDLPVRDIPPLPGLPTVITNSSQLLLDPNWIISAIPQTRTFDWVISAMPGAPDAFNRDMLVVNGQFPGPLIEANAGDTIIVNLQNNLTEGTSIHWHGITQNGTVYMDGLVGVNMCPIPPGGSFQYKFTLAQQYGTFSPIIGKWLGSMIQPLPGKAHALLWVFSSLQYTDGILGPIVIHSVDDPLVLGVHYDVDQIIMLDDWWHDNASYIFSQLTNNPTGYDDQGGASPSPDSVLINGVGSSLSAAGEISGPAPPEIQVELGKIYRFRLINTGSHAQQRFSIDDHPLTIIEADGTPVAGPSLHRVPIHDGQRYSVLVDANVGLTGGAFWIRSSVITSCMTWIASDLNPTAVAVLRYVVAGVAPTNGLPTSSDWSDPSTTTTGPCIDVDPTTMPPLVPQNVPATATQYALFNFQLAPSFTAFDINGLTFVNHPYETILQSVYGNQTLPDNVASQTFNSLAQSDIVINNLDTGLDHPVHLHGRNFWIIASGAGSISESEAAAIAPTTSNPLKRDTVVVPRSTYVILRLLTDVPGVWGIHCHIAWHIADGFLAAVIIQPDAIRSAAPPAEWTNLCAQGSNSTIIPGKRAALDGAY